MAGAQKAEADFFNTHPVFKVFCLCSRDNSTVRENTCRIHPLEGGEFGEEDGLFYSLDLELVLLLSLDDESRRWCYIA